MERLRCSATGSLAKNAKAAIIFVEIVPVLSLVYSREDHQACDFNDTLSIFLSATSRRVTIDDKLSN